MTYLDNIETRATASPGCSEPDCLADNCVVRRDRVRLVAALRAVEALAADWKADYRAMIPDESRGAEYIYADGRDDAANEIHAAIWEALS